MNNVGHLELKIGDKVPDGMLETIFWAQKVQPTKIYKARYGEDLSQASGERKLVIAEGDEIVFDNGHVPIDFDARGKPTKTRHDAFIPTDNKGKPTGAEVRDSGYRRISKGVENALIVGFNGGGYETRSYGFYLPFPNPQPVLKLQEPVIILNAFGPGDHQHLDQPVLRLEKKEDGWYVKSGVNGPEFNHTWKILAPIATISQTDAQTLADRALRESERQHKITHIFDTVRSLPLRLVTNHWFSHLDDDHRYN